MFSADFVNAYSEWFYAATVILILISYVASIRYLGLDPFWGLLWHCNLLTFMVAMTIVVHPLLFLGIIGAGWGLYTLGLICIKPEQQLEIKEEVI